MFATIRVSSEPASDILGVPKQPFSTIGIAASVCATEARPLEAEDDQVGEEEREPLPSLDGLREGEVVVREGALPEI